MEVVIDTGVIHNFVRKPKKNKCRNQDRSTRDCYETVLDNPICNGSLIIGLDKDNSLISEWKKTCGVELIQQLIIRWQDLNVRAIKIVERLPAIPMHVSRKLLLLGFDDAIDKLVLKISLNLDDKIVVANDSDFWDPMQPTNQKIKGNPNASVAKLCKVELGVEILLPKQFLARL